MANLDRLNFDQQIFCTIAIQLQPRLKQIGKFYMFTLVSNYILIIKLNSNKIYGILWGGKPLVTQNHQSFEQISQHRLVGSHQAKLGGYQVGGGCLAETVKSDN